MRKIKKLWRAIWRRIEKHKTLLNLYYGLCLPYYSIRVFFVMRSGKWESLKIMSTQKTVDTIIKNRRSFVRYGEGEFRWIFGVKENMPDFQKNDSKLSKELTRVIGEGDKKYLLGLPMPFVSTDGMSLAGKYFWKKYIANFHDSIEPYIDDNYEYGNASWSDTSSVSLSEKKKLANFDAIRSIWENKSIVMVEGSGNKFGVNTDLISNAKDIKRVVCPATNAFDKYSEIMRIAKKADKEKSAVILIALGPTATVLAGDLADGGHFAIDIGHLNEQYIDLTKMVGRKMNRELSEDDYERSIYAKI